MIVHKQTITCDSNRNDVYCVHLKVPPSAKFLSVAQQAGQTWVWYELKEEEKDWVATDYVIKTLRMMGTGFGKFDSENYMFLGTVVTLDHFVWHIYCDRIDHWLNSRTREVVQEH